MRDFIFLLLSMAEGLGIIMALFLVMLWIDMIINNFFRADDD